MSTDGGSSSDEPTLADYLDAYRVRFLKSFDTKSTSLDRCISYFESVSNTPAPLDSHTNSVITGDFQSDIASIGRMKRLEDVHNVINKWVSIFNNMAADATSATPTSDAAALRDGVPGDVSMDAGQDSDVHDGASSTQTLNADLLLDIAGVERRLEPTAEDTEWIEQTHVRETRRQAKEQATAGEPAKYVKASHIVQGRDFEKLKGDIKKELKRLIEEQDDFWEPFRPDPALWANSDPAVLKHVESLKIPAVPLQTTSLPDMLLHRLGRLGESSPDIPALDAEMDARMQPLLDAADWDFFLKNASGVGKTRFMFELLLKRLGLYFNFNHQPSNPYGSCDTTTAFNQLRHGRRNKHGLAVYFAQQVDGSDAPDRVTRQNNESITQHLYSLLVYARVLVFSWFVEVYKQLCGDIDSNATRLWCLLQIRPLIRLGRSPTRVDLFDKVFRSVLMIDETSCRSEIQNILESCDQKGAKISLLLLDEVHVPAAMYRTAFEPYTKRSMDAGKTRPLLKPIVLAIREPFVAYSSRMLVSATEFDSDLINEAVGSSVMKSFGVAPRPFVDFGDYAQPSDIERTLLHFLGPAFVSRLGAGLRSDIEFWLAGRRRFLCTFIQWVMHQGANEVVAGNVLRQMVAFATGEAYAGDFIPIPGFAFRNLIPEKLRGEKIDTDLLDARGTLQHAVIYFVIKGRFPAFSVKERIFVTLGLGCFVPPTRPGEEEIVVVKESLVLVSATVWLTGPREKSLVSALNKALSNTNASPKGYAFEDIVQYMLWEAFSSEGGVPLNKIFDFRFLPPSWQGESARLIEVFRATSPDGQTKTLTTKRTARMGFAASTPGDTCSWFCKSETRRARFPFLQPDHLCGPDLILGLLLSNGVELLVCVQCKCWSQKHYKGDVWKAVTKMSPTGFYHTKKQAEQASSAANRASLVKQLQQFRVTPLKPMPAVSGSTPPEYTMIRVLATFNSAVAWPKFDSKYGAYPIASLADDFMKSATLKFSALEHAYQLALANTGQTVVIPT